MNIQFTDDIYRSSLFACTLDTHTHFFSDCIGESGKGVINSILTPRRNPNNDKLTIYWKLPYIAKFESLNKKVVNNINSVIEPTTSLKIAYKTLKSSTFFPNKNKISFGLRPMLCTAMNATNVLVALLLEKPKDICLRG